jgi:hypothetical protein
MNATLVSQVDKIGAVGDDAALTLRYLAYVRRGNGRNVIDSAGSASDEASWRTAEIQVVEARWFMATFQVSNLTHPEVERRNVRIQ